MVYKSTLLINISQSQILIFFSHTTRAHSGRTVHKNFDSQFVTPSHKLQKLMLSSKHSARQSVMGHRQRGRMRLTVNLATFIIIALKYSHQIHSIYS
jgi:hypothetical protein